MGNYIQTEEQRQRWLERRRLTGRVVEASSLTPLERELLDALLLVMPTCLAVNCWCEPSWDRDANGHQPKCKQARHAIERAEAKEKR